MWQAFFIDFVIDSFSQTNALPGRSLRHASTVGSGIRIRSECGRIATFPLVMGGIVFLKNRGQTTPDFCRPSGLASVFLCMK